MALEGVTFDNVVKCLVDLYNDKENSLSLSEKVKILETLGYGNRHDEVGELLAGKASLGQDGVIKRGHRYRVMNVAEAADE